MGDEIQDPKRTLPGAVALGGVICGLLYIGATLTLLMALPKNQIGVLAGIMQAVSRLADQVGVGWITSPFALVLSISIAGIASAWLSGSARIPFVAGLEQHVKLSAAKVWGVQLAAGFDRDRALAMYSRAMKRLSSVIGDQDPSLLGSLLRSRGTRTFYRVRIGADTRVAADDLCARIRRAGGACLVLRNMNVRG